MNDYKNQILETIEYLDNVEGELFTLNVNLMMSGEMEALNNLFDEDESIVFKVEDFNNCNDENVKILSKLIARISTDLATLKNINAVNDDLEF